MHRDNEPVESSYGRSAINSPRNSLHSSQQAGATDATVRGPTLIESACDRFGQQLQTQLIEINMIETHLDLLLGSRPTNKNEDRNKVSPQPAPGSFALISMLIEAHAEQLQRLIDLRQRLQVL